MAKCEVIDLSDSDFDGDFIQAKNAKVDLSPRYRYVYLTELVHVRINVL